MTSRSRAQLAGEQRGCVVLVDHRVDSLQTPVARTTGIPPPPHAIVHAPAASSALIAPSSTISSGAGEGTTRR